MTSATTQYMFPEMTGGAAMGRVSMCACGCGAEFVQKGYGRPRLYLSAAHKNRAYAARKRSDVMKIPRGVSLNVIQTIRETVEEYHDYYGMGQAELMARACDFIIGCGSLENARTALELVFGMIPE